MKAYLTQPLHQAGFQSLPNDAIVFNGERVSRASFVDRVARLASVLRKLGMQTGDRVGMLSLNSHRYMEYLFGVWWGGGAVNPVNIRWSPAEVAYSLDDCDTEILLVDDAFISMVPKLRASSKSLRTVIYAGEGKAPPGTIGYEALLREATPIEDAYRQGDDLAAVMYTGGTTGMPKGVMLSHENLVTNVVNVLISIPRVVGSTALVAAPLFHIGGCGMLLQAVYTLQTIVIVPSFDDTAVLTALQEERVTEVFLVPTMIKRLVDHPRFAEFDTSSLRLMIYGAAPIDSALLTQAVQAFPATKFFQAYGMTECSPAITILPSEAHLPQANPKWQRSAGRPILQAELRIVDDGDNELPVGGVGEIISRGPMVMQGYYNKPQETELALRNGWMHTGDVGYRDEDGFLYVVDRKKDMIVSGGENVYSAEVENAIAQLPEVAMSAVIGIPDEKFGESVHAVIVLRPGAKLTAEQIQAHCRQSIAGYKCPRSVEFRDQIPLSAAGKLVKYELREPYWEGRSRRVN
ncbi:long-chain-fatty-acid--CoA ligase [Bradyrhizobium manausense]|uniref:long-chain-fatty-acid--CoA ligase n=1 Tax=Bradyrhizobium manausense TaxID=989370 RepID=UPI0032E00BAC